MVNSTGQRSAADDTVDPRASAGEPVGGDPLASGVLAEGRRLVSAAAAEGVPIRLIGSLAVLVRCPSSPAAMAAMGRRPARDIDLVTYARHEAALERLLDARGYMLDPALRHSREFGIKRLVFHNHQQPSKVDVFLDQLVMAHTVDLRGRLELHDLTVPLADLVLSKLQIHEITANDLIDLAVLLAEHEVAARSDAIDLDRLTTVLTDDWGYCYEALRNLAALEASLDGFAGLQPSAAGRVRERIEVIRRHVDQAPKTRRWRLRARIGTRLRWYEDVGDVR
jgi:hypothetical protein